MVLKNEEIHGFKGVCHYEIKEYKAAINEFNKAFKFKHLNKNFINLRIKSLCFRYKNGFLFLLMCVAIILISILLK